MKKITLLVLAVFMGVAFQATAQEEEIVLSQSIGTLIAGGVTCPGGDNWYFRSYDLADYGLSGDVMVTGMEIAVSNADYEEEFEFYAFEHVGFPAGFDVLDPPAPIASGYADIGPDDAGILLRIEFDDAYQVSPDATIVVAMVQPYAGGSTTYLMTTDAETKPSYLASENCGISEPETVGDVGFEDSRHVLNLVVDSEVASVNNVLQGNVAVYPNPTTDVFNIQLPSNVVVNSSSLVDVLGKTTGITYSNGTMNVSALAPGVYFLNLETNMGTYTQKVVKQ